MKNSEIWCPKCEYKPKVDDRWDCIPSCGTRWHTFWTGGVCPGCAAHWDKTQCPSCNVISPHKQWYHQPAKSDQERTQDTTITASD